MPFESCRQADCCLLRCSAVTQVQEIRLGLLGFGNVGSALAGQLTARSADITNRTGLALRISRVAVRDLSRKRPGLDRRRATDDPAAVIAADDVDVVVELMGGIEPARTLVLDALRSGKPVITGNKELIAAHGGELFAAADKAGVDLLFEAAVGGGIPIIRPLRESLVGERIVRILGIVNGTTNFILTKMTEQGQDYSIALAEAQDLGYAEANPTADVGGHDAASKAAILASIAFGQQVTSKDVKREGIDTVTAADVAFARELGHVIKLLAVAEDHDGQLTVRVYPAMIPMTHPLASVRHAFNAVFVEGEDVGRLMFYGRGAGGGPTGSAVLGDVIDASMNLVKGTHASMGKLTKMRRLPETALRSSFYLNVEVTDQPGVLAAVATVFARHAISIESMEQSGLGSNARIVFITHEANESDMNKCLKDLGRLKVVKRIVSTLRVIEDR
jgi:homoserine dehydrogenase